MPAFDCGNLWRKHNIFYLIRTSISFLVALFRRHALVISRSEEPGLALASSSLAHTDADLFIFYQTSPNT